jgi:hypothetical protein
MHGTYYLEGESSSRPGITASSGLATIQNFTYSGGRFSANMVYTSTGTAGVVLTFQNTGGGVRNVKLMKPRAPGSSSPYSTTTTFTDQVKKMVEKFDVIRFMWAVDGWNGAWQVQWADRVQTEYASYNRGSGEVVNGVKLGWAGKGMPWEMAIKFCNETGKDMWINMPLGADDDYIRQLATLVRDTYTVADGKVYVEYSNEATWDFAGVCSAYLRKKGLEEAGAKGPVGYDGIRDENIIPARYYAKRAAEISVIWRGVWGDAAMMTQVRPVACGQLKYDSELIWGLEFISNWFGNGDGNHVAEPHPVNYYFYGCGGSHYTGDDPDAVTNGVREIDAFEAYEEEEACLAKMYGLKRCAYEGGVWSTPARYMLPSIGDAMVRYHKLWDKYDCDLLSYFVTTGAGDEGKALCFTQSAFDLDTPKYRALETILSSSKDEPTGGKMAPCAIDGADFSVNSTISDHPAPGGAVTSGGASFNEWHVYRGYLFRVSHDGIYDIGLSYSQTSNAYIEIMVDGKVVAREKMSGTASPVYSINLKKGLHAIRVKKMDAGNIFLNYIQIM